MKRRDATTFGLSFLDIMSCGLGAAVLLFLIIKHQSDQTVEVAENLSAETNLLEQEILIGQENLARIKNTINDVDDQLVEANGLARQIKEDIDKLQAEIEDLGPSAGDKVVQIEEQLNKLQKQKEALEQENQGGNRNVEFLGDGDRQYLTGIKLGGERVLVLIDSSASMLDETIINVVRRRNRSDDVKLASEKWQQAISIVEWIVANLDPGAQFQLYTFNETTTTTHEEFEGKWLDTEDRDNMNIALNNLSSTVPENGTNLHDALAVINTLSPRPDNVFLITDGLPTQSDEPSKDTTVSGNQRLRFFNDAKQNVPGNVPINTLLMPMEGDLLAASAYWQLAIETRGSFVAPPRDWP